MNPDALVQWLNRYGDAWMHLDPRLATALFAPDAIFTETPFSDPIRGRDAIGVYWAAMSRVQDQVDFAYEVLSVTPNMGIAQWWASFVRTTPDSQSVHIKLDGIAVIGLDSQNLCISFHQWWHAQETPIENV